MAFFTLRNVMIIALAQSGVLVAGVTRRRCDAAAV
jgi:hypothetical protein